MLRLFAALTLISVTLLIHTMPALPGHEACLVRLAKGMKQVGNRGMLWAFSLLPNGISALCSSASVGVVGRQQYVAATE